MDYPVFAHQLRALRAARDKADREAWDGTLIRAPRRRRRRYEDRLNPRPVSDIPGVDWWAPSPLIDFDRNPTSFRIPTLLLTPISKAAVPRGPSGETLPDYPDPMISVVGHYGYIERQERAFRAAGQRDGLEADDVSDFGDVEHVCTNIDRNPNKRRAFARAVYRTEMLGQIHQLLARTDAVAWFEQQAGKPNAPTWLKKAYRQLRKAAEIQRRQALQKGKEPKPCYVPVSPVTEREAYDRIIWCEAQEGWDKAAKQVAFKSARGGRVQYRLMFQLPYWISPQQRLEIVRKIARYLGKRGFMYVAAIHRPDPHNDPRNFHVHIDAYDRPCRFLKRQRCWDIEHVEKRRNGAAYRRIRNKVEGFAQSVDAKNRREQGKGALQELRETFCRLTNKVLERSLSALRYHPGPFEALGLNLRSTAKLGGRAMAAEAIGVRTIVGDSNAGKIWSDVFDAIYRQRREARVQALGRVRDLRSMLVKVLDTRERHYLAERLTKLAADQLAFVERRFLFELGQAEIRMMSSRAATVVREADRRGARRSGKGYRNSSLGELAEASLAGAEQHLSFIAELDPHPHKIAEERAFLMYDEEQIEVEQEALIGEIEASQSRVPQSSSAGLARIDDTRIRITPNAFPAELTDVQFGAYDQIELARLLAWFDRNERDADRLQNDGDSVEICASRSTCARFEKFIRTPGVRGRIASMIEFAANVAAVRDEEHLREQEQLAAAEAQKAEEARRREELDRVERMKHRIWELGFEVTNRVLLQHGNDVPSVRAYLNNRPDDLEALMHPAVQGRVSSTVSIAYDEQQRLLKKALQFIRETDDPKLLRMGFPNKAEDSEVREFLRHSYKWPQINDAIELAVSKIDAARMVAVAADVGPTTAAVAPIPEAATVEQSAKEIRDSEIVSGPINEEQTEANIDPVTAEFHPTHDEAFPVVQPEPSIDHNHLARMLSGQEPAIEPHAGEPEIEQEPASAETIAPLVQADNEAEEVAAKEVRAEKDDHRPSTDESANRENIGSDQETDTSRKGLNVAALNDALAAKAAKKEKKRARSPLLAEVRKRQRAHSNSVSPPETVSAGTKSAALEQPPTAVAPLNDPVVAPSAVGEQQPDVAPALAEASLQPNPERPDDALQAQSRKAARDKLIMQSLVEFGDDKVTMAMEAIVVALKREPQTIALAMRDGIVQVAFAEADLRSSFPHIVHSPLELYWLKRMAASLSFDHAKVPASWGSASLLPDTTVYVFDAGHWAGQYGGCRTETPAPQMVQERGRGR